MFWFSNQRRKIRFIFRRRRRFRRKGKSVTDETTSTTSKKNKNNQSTREVQEAWLRVQKKEEDVPQIAVNASSSTEKSKQIWREQAKIPSSFSAPSTSSSSSSSTTDDNESFSTAYSFEELEDASLMTRSSSSSSSCCDGSVNSKKSVKFLLPPPKGRSNYRLPIRTPAKTCQTLLHGNIPLAKLIVDPSETISSVQLSRGTGSRLHIVGTLPTPVGMDEKYNKVEKNEDRKDSGSSVVHDSSDHAKEHNLKEESVKYNDCQNQKLPGPQDNIQYQVHLFVASDDASVEAVPLDFSAHKVATKASNENIKILKDTVKAMHQVQRESALGQSSKNMTTLNIGDTFVFKVLNHLHEKCVDRDQPSLIEVSCDGCTDDSSCEEIVFESSSDVVLHENIKVLDLTEKEHVTAQNVVLVFNVLLLMALQASLLKFVAVDRLKHDA